MTAEQNDLDWMWEFVYVLKALGLDKRDMSVPIAPEGVAGVIRRVYELGREDGYKAGKNHEPSISNAPKVCMCGSVSGRHGFGDPGCEYHDHHCLTCHERGVCTKRECPAS